MLYQYFSKNTINHEVRRVRVKNYVGQGNQAASEKETLGGF